jgi:hypothetical protein
MARPVAKAQLTSVWTTVLSYVAAGALAVLVADGMAEVSEKFGAREWRRG